MVDSVGPAGGGFSGGGDFGSIGSSGLSSFDLGGIAPNGGGPEPTGTGDLGAAGLSPIGSSGLTAFGPPGGMSEAAKLDHYDSLVQQNWDQLDAARQQNEDLSRSIAQIGTPVTPPALPTFTSQPLDTAGLVPPPFTAPVFTLPPEAAAPAPTVLGPPALPAPPAFMGQPLDATGFPAPAPLAPTFALPPEAGGPIPAASGVGALPAPAGPEPFTPFAMAPDALASPVTRPDIAAPGAPLDPFAPIGEGGLGLGPIGLPATTVFGLDGAVGPADGGVLGAAPALNGATAFAEVPPDPAAWPAVPAAEAGLPPWAPFGGTPLPPLDAAAGVPPAGTAAEPPSYFAGLLDAARQGNAFSYVRDRYWDAVAARDGALFPSFESVFNGTMKTGERGIEEIQAAAAGIAQDLDYFDQVRKGTVSPYDPETGMPTDEAIRRSFNLATLGISGGLLGTELRAGGTMLGAGPIRTAGPGAWRPVGEAMSARAATYQEQITGRTAGQSYIVNGTKFDGFNGRELLDAKGPGYAWAVRDGEFRAFFSGADSLVAQAQRQVSAAGGRPITWHVAEPEAAQAMQNLFRVEGITGINVVHTPVAR